MDYYKYWEECSSMLENGQIDEAKTYIVGEAKKLGVSDELIDKIFAVNLKRYENKLKKDFDELLKQVTENTQAVCLYYSVDNSWGGTYYICNTYDDNDINWFASSREWIDTARMRKFGEIFERDAESAFFSDPEGSGILSLLMYRTTVVFSNVIRQYKDLALKIGISCDEDSFVKIHEVVHNIRINLP